MYYLILSKYNYSPKNSLLAMNILSSLFKSAVSSIPRGKLTPSKRVVPEGIEIEGQPLMLAGTVKISARYISSGDDFSPNLKAGVGVVGVRIKSTSLNTSRSSLVIISLALSADP